MEKIDKIDGGKVIEKDGKIESKMGFLISGTKLAYAMLRQAYIIDQILDHFDPECHI